MRRVCRGWGVVAFLFAGCVAKREAPVAEPVAPQIQAERSTATPPAERDPLIKEYRAATSLIRGYDGDSRKLQQARAQLVSILGRNRDYAPAYVGLAMIEYRSGYRSGGGYDPVALDRAMKLVSHALKLDPNLFDAHATAAWIERYRGDLDAARLSIDVAEGLQPNDPALKLTRAELAEVDANPKEMLRYAREVIAESKDPRDRAAAYHYVIAAYTGGGHIEQAEAAHRELLALVPDSPWAHANYSAFLLRRDDTDGSIREAERAVSLSRDPFSIATLTRAYIQKADQLWTSGQTAEAFAFADRANALSMDHAEASVLLGTWYERIYRRGDDSANRDRAVAAYRRALALEPGNQQASSAIGRLGS
jgi:tetratricopeptide (TPR) repeat protein